MSGGVPMPVIGRNNAPPVHCLSLMPNSICNSMPSQNTGTDTRIDVDSVTSTSQKEYCFTAEMMPARRPTTISTRIAATARRIVFGNLSARIDVTDLLF